MEINTALEGDIAVVITESGIKFVAIYTLAPGIDYFWNPVIEGSAPGAFRDPEKSFTVIGRANEN